MRTQHGIKYQNVNIRVMASSYTSWEVSADFKGRRKVVVESSGKTRRKMTHGVAAARGVRRSRECFQENDIDGIIGCILRKSGRGRRITVTRALRVCASSRASGAARDFAHAHLCGGAHARLARA